MINCSIAHRKDFDNLPHAMGDTLTLIATPTITRYYDTLIIMLPSSSSSSSYTHDQIPLLVVVIIIDMMPSTVPFRDRCTFSAILPFIMIVVAIHSHSFACPCYSYLTTPTTTTPTYSHPISNRRWSIRTGGGGHSTPLV